MSDWNNAKTQVAKNNIDRIGKNCDPNCTKYRSCMHKAVTLAGKYEGSLEQAYYDTNIEICQDRKDVNFP